MLRREHWKYRPQNILTLTPYEPDEAQYRQLFDSYCKAEYLYQNRFWSAFYAVVTRAENQIIGLVSCCPRTTEDTQKHFGFHIDEAHWNRGYGTEAGEVLLDLVFSLGVKQVISGCFEGNVASVRALTKIGFRQTPIAFWRLPVQRWLRPPGRVPLHFSLTVEQWRTHG